MRAPNIEEAPFVPQPQLRAAVDTQFSCLQRSMRQKAAKEEIRDSNAFSADEDDPATPEARASLRVAEILYRKIRVVVVESVTVHHALLKPGWLSCSITMSNICSSDARK
jgi:hypothetical protein